MPFEIKTQIEIKASPKDIWEVLTDFENYPAWNPFIKSIKGEVQVGGKIAVEFDKMKFTPLVLSFEESKKFVWKGKLLMRGIFDGEHSFEIISKDEKTSVFIQSEKFTGILVPLFKKKLKTEIKGEFENMNEKLKAKVEGR